MKRCDTELKRPRDTEMKRGLRPETVRRCPAHVYLQGVRTARHDIAARLLGDVAPRLLGRS